MNDWGSTQLNQKEFLFLNFVYFRNIVYFLSQPLWSELSMRLRQVKSCAKKCFNLFESYYAFILFHVSWNDYHNTDYTIALVSSLWNLQFWQPPHRIGCNLLHRVSGDRSNPAIGHKPHWGWMELWYEPEKYQIAGVEWRLGLCAMSHPVAAINLRHHRDHTIKLFLMSSQIIPLLANCEI